MVRIVFGRFLLFLVIVNATGIPFALHYCSVMGAYTHQACAMCEEQKAVKEKPSCCAEDETESDYTIHIANSKQCCSEHIVAAPLVYDAERTVPLKELVSPAAALAIADMATTPCADLTRSTAHFANTSPPGQASQNLTLLNATLRI